jgi:hypothetical protein
MVETMFLIMLLVLVPMVVQLFAITFYWHRMAAMLQRAADRPPFNTALTIASVGPEPKLVTRLLERMTRLDTAEIDRLVRAQGGRLPLPMSRPAALRLAQELRRAGADVQLAERDTPAQSQV